MPAPSATNVSPLKDSTTVTTERTCKQRTEALLFIDFHALSTATFSPERRHRATGSKERGNSIFTSGALCRQSEFFERCVRSSARLLSNSVAQRLALLQHVLDALHGLPLAAEAHEGLALEVEQVLL